MKRRFIPKVVAVFLLIAVLMFSMSSCMLMWGDSSATGDFLTRSELDSILNSRLDGDITVEGGDNYDININTSNDGDIIAASKALLSSVSVSCEFDVTYVVGWGPMASPVTEKAYSSGSGVIYKMDKTSGDAYIITNYHVVHYAESNSESGISNNINVFLYGKEYSDYAIPATYVGGSMNYDLAVLKVSRSKILVESIAAAVSLRDSDEITVLDTAIAIGNSEGEGISATVGHVNVESEYINMVGSDGYTEISLRVMRTDAAVNSGNSGGGLFDSKGQLIGIVNAKMATSDVDNIAYAIPSNVARSIAENIIYHCDGKDNKSVYKYALGITVNTTDAYTEYDIETGKVIKREEVVVSGVMKSSIVYGKVFENDVIKTITVDGKEYEVDRVFKVVDSMLNAREGSTVVIKVSRGGTDFEITVQMRKSDASVVQ